MRDLKDKEVAPWVPGALVGVAVSFVAFFHGMEMPGIDLLVMGAVVGGLSLCLLQSILGHMRRRSRSFSIQCAAMAAFYLPSHCALHAANAVWSSTNPCMLYISWCFALVFFSGQGAFDMQAYTLSDPGRLQIWSHGKWLLYLTYLHCGFSTRDPSDMLLPAFGLILSQGMVSPLFSLARPTLSVLEYKAKEVADHMKQQSRLPSLFFDGDAGSLYTGCRYPFMRRDGEWVTMKQLLERHVLLPDICLSYSFFQLSTRRYFGFPCSEAGNPMVRDFVLTELIPAPAPAPAPAPDDRNANYSRVFDIVEVQLAFLHDYFFTAYHSIMNSSTSHEWYYPLVGKIVEVISLGSPVLCFSWLFFTRSAVGVPQLAFCLIVALILSLITRLRQKPVLPVYWYTIRAAAEGSAYSPSVVEKNVHRWFGKTYWQDKIGQYSLIEDYDRHFDRKAFLARMEQLMLSGWPPSYIERVPVEEDPIKLPERVRKMVALALQGINGPLTNGTRSLQNNQNIVQDLDWTCREETPTHTILIWHIATCCFDTLPLAGSPDHQVASALSRYCAYLVSALPKLLPGQSLTTTLLLQQVLKEARDVLGTARMATDVKCSTMLHLELPTNVSVLTTFQKGVRLGQQLDQVRDESARWKVMAEFWAETSLYIAPSDNVAMHVEQLAKGGEFVTHLWALLSNAGIMKREAE